MNTFNVAKFGGTSMADFSAMDRCAQIVLADNNIRLVVVSASSGITNKLLALAATSCTKTQRNELLTQIGQQHHQILAAIDDGQLIKTPLDELLLSLDRVAARIAEAHSAQLVDELLSFGERMSSLIFTAVLAQRVPGCQCFDARTVMQTDGFFNQAEPWIAQIKTLAGQELSARCQRSVVVTQGFIGSDENGNTTTLGRGGSDLSAALFAEALEADELQIWTDVDGIYTTDPRVVPNAIQIPELSFDEAAELSVFGAKVLHPSTLWPAIRQNIRVFVGNSRDRLAKGTWIKKTVASSPNYRAIATRSDQTLITLKSLKMLHNHGFLAKIFALLAEHKISVDLVTTSEVSVALTLDKIGSQDASGFDADIIHRVVGQLSEWGEVSVEQGLALVAIVGNRIEQQSGISARIFSVLSPYNLRMICHGASGHNICLLVEQYEANDVLCSLHRELFE